MRAPLTALAVAAALSGLPGCGEAPRPFAHDGASSGAAIDAVALMGPRASLMVAPVAGLDAEAARSFAEAVAKELRRKDVAAFTRAGGRASWLLQLSADDPRRAAWRLVDPSGRPTAQGSSAADAVALAAQVDAAMASLVRPPAVERRQAVRLGPVDGVNAETARLLGMALQAELRRVGVPVAESADALVLSGKVSRTDAGGGTEEVEIAWTVAQPDGEEIGTIGQSNRLPKGQIDGRWPAVAGAVAAGVADGIVDIVDTVATARK